MIFKDSQAIMEAALAFFVIDDQNRKSGRSNQGKLMGGLPFDQAPFFGQTTPADYPCQPHSMGIIGMLKMVMASIIPLLHETHFTNLNGCSISNLRFPHPGYII